MVINTVDKEGKGEGMELIKEGDKRRVGSGGEGEEVGKFFMISIIDNDNEYVTKGKRVADRLRGREGRVMMISARPSCTLRLSHSLEELSDGSNDEERIRLVLIA